MNIEEWEAFTRETYEMMESPAYTFLLIFTGMKSLSTGKDEYAIYPPLKSTSGEKGTSWFLSGV